MKGVRGLEILLSKSPIHGFTFLHQARNKSEIIFWVVIMSTFLIILSVDITKLTTKYFSRDKLSKLEMVHHELTKLPPLFACLDVNSEHIIHATVANDGFSIKDTLSGYKTKKEFLENLYNISEPQVLSTVYRYLAFMAVDEWSPLQKLNSHRPVEELPDHPYEMENFKNLEKKLGELDIDVVELKRFYAQILIKTYITRATFVQKFPNQSTQTINVLSEKTTLWSLNRNGVTCFQLTLPELMYRGPPEPMIQIEINYTRLHATKDQYLDRRFGLWLRHLHVYVMHHKENPSNHLMHKARSGLAIDFRLEISAEYKRLANQETRCGAQSVVACHELCMSEMIQNICQCDPLFLTLASNSSQLGSCKTMLNYRGSCSSLRNMTTELFPDETAKCMDNCVSPCQLIVYSSKAHGSQQLEGEGEVTLYGALGLFDYPQYQQVLAITWESFMGAFGGNLGIWFGASILSVIHILFVIIDYCFKRWKVSPYPITEENQNSDLTQKKINPDTEIKS